MRKPGFSSMTPVLCVADVAASLRHYEQVLGFDIAWKWSADDAFGGAEKPTFACVSRGDCCLFLCEQGQGNPGSWVCLNVSSRDELDAIYAEYQERSADIAQPPEDCSWGMREMIVRDPDGNVFRIGCVIASDCD